MSRQNYYKTKRKRQRKKIDDTLIGTLVKDERIEQPRIGGRKLLVLIQQELHSNGIKLGRDLFFKLLKEKDLLVKPRPRKPRTTNSYHCLPVFKNLLKAISISKPNQAWASDITYLRTQNGFVYLSLITDMFSRKIVGYHVDDTLETQGCINALNKALKQLPKGARPIHHSDRGSQYCSHIYVDKLSKHKLTISMTEENHCYENAMAERVNGILKQEYYLDITFAHKQHAKEAVDEVIYLYNHRRPHQALNYKKPQQIHEMAA